MALKWNDSLAIGVEEVDAQHKELFLKLNQLLDACNQGKGKDAVREMVAFLQDYVVEHFATEERLQRQFAFPEYEYHRGLHAEFLRAAGDLKLTLEEKGPTLPFIIAVNKTVVDWLSVHISKADKEMGRYLTTKMSV